MTESNFAIAVFPFLKTTASVTIGNYTFNSTANVEALPQSQAQAVNEIAKMLFVQGDLRIKSASYAIVPDLEVHSGDRRLAELAYLRDVVTYSYSAPDPVFDTIFLPPEEISLVLFTPSRVSVFLTRPEHHTESISLPAGPEPDSFNYVPGYNGLYNFRHTFWVEPGSRLYGPKPHMTLNISQDLHADFEHRMAGRPDYHLLFGLLRRPDSPASLRVYSALRWYNAANERGLDESHAVLNLAVAFETLLRLPEFSKSDRLIDAISLLLGRTERLDDWAEQFYNARSRVAHEGNISDRCYYAPGAKKPQVSDIFGSLMLYGRQVFQLCLSTLLVGIDLAARADLQEKFITNNERYQKLCELLQVATGTPNQKLLGLVPTVRALERYRFVVSGLDSGPLLTAARLASATLTECNEELPEDVANALSTCANSKREDGELRRLATIEALDETFGKLDLTMLTPVMRVVREIIHLIWTSLYQRYYWLKERDQNKKT